MKRRLVVAAGACLGALLALAALAVVLRTEIADVLLGVALGRAGFAGATLEVESLDSSELRLSDVVLAPEATASAVILRYSLAGLGSGRLGEVEVRGLRLHGEVGTDGVRIDGLAAPAGGGTGAPVPLERLPFERLLIDDALLSFRSPAGPVAVAASGAVLSGPEAAGRFDYRIAAPQGWLSGRLDVSLPAAGETTIDLVVSDGEVEALFAAARGLTGALQAHLRGGEVLRGAVELRSTDARAAVVDGPGGTIAVRGRYVPERVDLDVRLREAADAASVDIAVSGSPEGASLPWTLSADLAAGERSALWAGGTRGRGRLRVEVRGQGDPALRSAQLALDLTATGIAYGDLHADEIALALPLTVARSDEQVRAALRAPGRLTATGLARGSALRLAAPLRARIAAAEVVMPRNSPRPGDAVLVHSVELGAEALSLAGANPGARLALEELAVVLAGRWEAAAGWRGEATVRAAKAAAPGAALAIRDVELVAGRGGAGWRGRAAATALGTGEPAWLAPLGVAATVQARGAALTFGATARTADGAAVLALDGGYDLARATGRAVATVGPLRFSPEALQPGDLSAYLAAFAPASGEVSARAEIVVADGAASGTGELAARDLSFRVAGIDVTDLNGRLELSGLNPPVSPPAQSLRLSALDLPVPFADVVATYRIAPGPRLDVAEISAAALGGTLWTGAFSVAPGQPVEIALTVRGIQLERVVALAGREAMSGTGTLDGQLPLVIDAGTVALEGGRLAARGPGVLRLPSQTVREAVDTGSEDLDLVVRVFEDFRYDEMTVAIDKPDTGEARVALSMLGHNPAVLDGHPFRFNISVASNVDELIAAMLEAYRRAAAAIAGPGAKASGR